MINTDFFAPKRRVTRKYHFDAHSHSQKYHSTARSVVRHIVRERKNQGNQSEWKFRSLSNLYKSIQEIRGNFKIPNSIHETQIRATFANVQLAIKTELKSSLEHLLTMLEAAEDTLDHSSTFSSENYSMEEALEEAKEFERIKAEKGGKFLAEILKQGKEMMEFLEAECNAFEEEKRKAEREEEREELIHFIASDRKLVACGLGPSGRSASL